MAARQFRIEHVQKKPRGWRVRTVRSGSHELRIGFPPGPRRKGAGELLEVLHPKKEARNPRCQMSEFAERAKANPEELVIFGLTGNPSKANARRTKDADIREKLRGGNPGRMTITHDPAEHQFRAQMPDPRNERNWIYAWGSTKKQAAKALRDIWRQVRPRGNPRRRRRRNQISETEQAVRLFETFHGKDLSGILEKHISAAMRKDYAALGKLIAVITDCNGYGDREIAQKWDRCNHVDFSEDGITLASSPDGRQLYAIGGNQNMNGCLEKFEGVDATKDFIDLGEIAGIVYEARKVHDNFEPIEYVHKFGGHGLTCPAWMYDRLKKQIFFLGGEYHIDTTQRISPGIEG